MALDYPLVEPEALRMKQFLAEKSPPLVAGLIRALAWMLRFRLEDPENIFGRNSHQPRIFAFWHNRILMMPFLYEKYCPGRRMLMLVSRSRDGELITQIMNRFGIDGARGSTSKGGADALREMIRELEKEGARDIGITPDGPRGPRGKVQDGVLVVAAASGLSITPVTTRVSWKWRLPSWDRFQIPIPGAECCLVVGPSIPPPPSVDPEKFGPTRTRLEEVLGD